MAKQTDRSAPGRPRPQLPTPSAEGSNYFKQVWEELKKVVWPSRNELSRMTGVVVVTVILFAVVIGTADYALAYGISKVYLRPAATAKPKPAAPTHAASASPAPSTSPSPTASPAASPH